MHGKLALPVLVSGKTGGVLAIAGQHWRSWPDQARMRADGCQAAAARPNHVINLRLYVADFAGAPTRSWQASQERPSDCLSAARELVAVEIIGRASEKSVGRNGESTGEEDDYSNALESRTTLLPPLANRRMLLMQRCYGVFRRGGVRFLPTALWWQLEVKTRHSASPTLPRRQRCTLCGAIILYAACRPLFFLISFLLTIV